jgi:hypothetical protein
MSLAYSKIIAAETVYGNRLMFGQAHRAMFGQAHIALFELMHNVHTFILFWFYFVSLYTGIWLDVLYGYV